MTLLDRPIEVASATRRVRGARRGETADLWSLDLQGLSELAVELNGRPVPGVRMTEREFVEWCPSGLRAEWADREVFLSPPANAEHNRLDIWFVRVVGDFIEPESLGVIYTNVWVRLAPRKSRRVPDLVFIAKQREHIVKRTVINGPPDLIIEVVSPDSQSRDRRTKFLEYEAAGVREYWIVDPLSRTLEVYVLRRRKYRRLTEDENGFVASTVLASFRIKVEWLWQNPLPKVAATLRQMTAGAR